MFVHYLIMYENIYTLGSFFALCRLYNFTFGYNVLSDSVRLRCIHRYFSYKRS